MACLVVGIAAPFLFGFTSDGNGSELHWSALPVCLPWVFALLWCGPRLPALAPLEWVGRNSLVFYVAHFPILVLVAQVAATLGASAPVVYLAGTIAAYGLTWLMARHRRRLDWLFRMPGGRTRPVSA